MEQGTFMNLAFSYWRVMIGKIEASSSFCWRLFPDELTQIVKVKQITVTSVTVDMSTVVEVLKT
jgi:hypothetical protein